MRKKGSYRKNKLFCLLAVAVLRFVQSYLNDIAHRGSISIAVQGFFMFLFDVATLWCNYNKKLYKCA